ncbi:MAG: DUF3667 domain-containing protein [Saprospiraceae bacterium]|uniref:DUF3667 domain-containing protein n=1 Tax=Candidatus Opimibacter skivensis TaxID=2982028 RepID=A0A9D7SUL0_9BACT|nr:DUF3667 domain-containing protein [Candidatus Opimibacter skivensis]
MNHCKNCGHPVKDLYCGHCGQKAILGRITFAYIWGELFHFFTHIEHGFIFTSVKLLTTPGKTVATFIEGKRKSYQSPISYFLVWTTIFIVFLYWMEKTFGENTVIDYKNYWGPSGTTNLAISHLSIVLTILIPFQALYLYLLFTRIKYNYFETLVAAIYLVGTVIQLQFMFALVALIMYGLNHSSTDLRISDILKFGFFIWFCIDFIKLFAVRSKFVRVLGFVLLAGATFTLWRIFGVPVLVNLLFEHN